MREFADSLKNKLSTILPGVIAQNKMLPSMRLPDELLDKNRTANRKHGAVLILLYEKDKNLHTCFIKRAEDGGTHSGQIGLPGGKHEQNDENCIQTALREAEEEIGINSCDVEVLGELTKLYIPVSNYSVLPVVGKLDYEPFFIPNKSEVNFVIEAKISELIDEKNLKIKEFNPHSMKITAPCFALNGHLIWGATAMIISEFLEVIKDIRIS